MFHDSGVLNPKMIEGKVADLTEMKKKANAEPLMELLMVLHLTRTPHTLS